jgi:tRNA (guanine-N7-)-methyltransferase
MPRKKKSRIETVKDFPNIFEDTKFLKGKWAQDIFGNDHPITLELGCGKGEYTNTLAEKYPQQNFIGIDIKGVRLWSAATAATEKGLKNAVYLRIRIQDITEYFEEKEVSGIWITFPDPYSRQSKFEKRLISLRFLPLYKKILKPHSTLHFKTDSDELFAYALNVLEKEGHELLGYTFDLYRSDMLNELTAIRTAFENKYLEQGKSIKYLRFRFSYH